MTNERMRAVGVAGAVAWLVVAASGVRRALVDGGDGWELPYVVFSAALLVAVVLTVAVVGRLTRRSGRTGLRTVGLVVCGLGVAASFVAAWAALLWMAILGVGFALIALASDSGGRRGALLLAAAQLGGLAVLILGLLAKIGRQDEWNDYPVAHGLSLAVVGLAMVLGLAMLMGSRRAEAGPSAA